MQGVGRALGQAARRSKKQVKHRWRIPTAGTIADQKQAVQCVALVLSAHIACLEGCCVLTTDNGVRQLGKNSSGNMHDASTCNSLSRSDDSSNMCDIVYVTVHVGMLVS